jgi:cytoskeletal protein CcmA (bactofilin family)
MAQARSISKGGDEARIGSGTKVRGRIAGDGDLLIEGAVEGDIALKGALTIAEGAEVVSEIDAHTVTISGSLEGSVTASGPVRVAAGSRVKGDLRGSSVAIEEGAHYAGRLECEFELPPELGAGPAAPRQAGRAAQR